MVLQVLSRRAAAFFSCQQFPAYRGNLHTGFVPDQQGKAQFILQGIHHVSQAGLRIAQFFRCGGK